MAPKKGGTKKGAGKQGGKTAVEQVDVAALPRKMKGTLEDAVERIRKEKFADF